METGSRRRVGHASKMGKQACALLSDSSESSDGFLVFQITQFNPKVTGNTAE